MTCVIGFKDSENIYIAADSLGSNGIVKNVRVDKKVFRKDDMIIGFAGSYRMGQLIQYKFEVPEHPKDMDVDTYMRTFFIDELIECLVENGFTQIVENQKIGASFLVGYKDRLYEIEDDYHVSEPSLPYASIGNGAEVALGAMNALIRYSKKISPTKLLTLALEASEEIACGVASPFIIMKKEIQ